ncbi:MAG: hypothetical protein HFI75_04805 [Lachnospiraceae bacterium]|nr:hypothetical protein [Lachnospiraceae bacterium]
MKEYMELPVNKEGFLHSGTKQAALYAILSSEKYAGEKNAVISGFRILSEQGSFDYFSEAEEFTKQLVNIKQEFDHRHQELRFYSHPYTGHKYAYLYRSLACGVPCYGAEIQIAELQDSDAWSAVKIICSKGMLAYDQKAGKAYFENECSLTLTSQGRVYLRISQLQKEKRIFETEKDQTVYLRLELKEQVVVKYSLDGIYWNMICEEPAAGLEFDEIGLWIEPKINSFYNDFFTANVQLIWNKEKRRMMTYPQLDYDDRYFSNRLEGYSMPRGLIRCSGMERIEFFIQLIEDGYYVYLKLQNRYETEGEGEQEQEELKYISILYGFDRRKQHFKRMTFNPEFAYSEISFQQFSEMYDSGYPELDIITLYRYKSWRYPNCFHADRIIANLEAYIEGKGSFFLTAQKRMLYLSKKPLLYGIKILEAIAEKEDCMESFLLDTALSRMICEHYTIMLHMLQYVCYMRALTKEEYQIHKAGFQELVRRSNAVDRLVFRYAISPAEEIREQLLFMFRDMIQMDKAETKRLIYHLKKNK